MDRDRFKTEIMPLRPAMLATARRMLGNADDAEDAVQEVLLRMWEIRGQVARMSSPAGYAVQALKNCCIDRLRADKHTADVCEADVSIDDETPYRATELHDAAAIVRQIVASLPRMQKMVVEMRDVEGYELEEIAAITGLQTTTVTVNLSRARKRVRDRFMLINNYKKEI